MFRRHLTEALKAAAATYPVVTLTGPRQSGKTTLVQALFGEYRYLSLEAPDVRARAVQDPRSFLTQADRLILDEIQRVPELLSYIQVLVDADSLPGRFILTGSQNLLLMESVSQTLAGRTAFLRLYPLSLSELRGNPSLDPLNLDRTRRKTTGRKSRRPRKGLWDTLLDGFYPRIHDRGIPTGEWLADYFRTYVERDLREVMQISDQRSFERFVRLAAAHTAQELNLTTFASDVGITQQTAKRWLTALEIGFLATTPSAPSRELSQAYAQAPAGCTFSIPGSSATCSIFGTPGRWSATRYVVPCSNRSSSRSWSRTSPRPAATRRCFSGETQPGTRSTS